MSLALGWGTLVTSPQDLGDGTARHGSRAYQGLCHGTACVAFQELGVRELGLALTSERDTRVFCLESGPLLLARGGGGGFLTG